MRRQRRLYFFASPAIIIGASLRSMKAVLRPAAVLIDLFVLVLVSLIFQSSPPALAAVAVLTHHNDLNRSGANLNENLLTTNNVNTNQFGRLFTRAVDDEIHTQPLIMTNVDVPGQGTHNLVIVATVNDSVYAFDADDPTVTAPIWQTNFLAGSVVAPKNTDMTFACGGNYRDFAGKIGIVG